MITSEQLSKLKAGDKVKFTYVPPKRKRPITRVMAFAPEENQEEGKIVLQSISEQTGKPLFGFYFIYSASDDKLSI